MSDISVIIPTRNRAALLGRCLAALCSQNLDAARFDICVVNNASIDVTPKAVDLVRAAYPKHRIKLIDEPIIGLSLARNTGIAATEAPLIASIDDDAIAPPDWLEKLVAAFAAQGGKVGKIGGEVMPLWGAPRPEWLSDGMLVFAAATTGLGGGARFVESGFLECNSCYRREALAAAGGFPATLGRKGSNLVSSENIVDLVLAQQGWKLYFNPSIMVAHFMSPDRLRPVWFRRRYFWQGVSDYAAQVYRTDKALPPAPEPVIDMPFDVANWQFVNNADDPPDEASLNRLRSLGFVLAKSGFMPIK